MSDQLNAPKQLDDFAVARCAKLVNAASSEGFGAELRSLVSLAWGMHTPGQRARRGAGPDEAARSQVVRTGRTFVKALKSAPIEVRRPFEIGLPFGVVFLEILLDDVAQSLNVKRGPKSARFRHEQFVILLFFIVRQTGGAMTITENQTMGLNGLLKELNPYLPPGFLLASYTRDNLRQLRVKAKTMQWSVGISVTETPP